MDERIDKWTEGWLTDRRVDWGWPTDRWMRGRSTVR